MIRQLSCATVAVYTIMAISFSTKAMAKDINLFLFAGQSNMAGADAVIDPSTGKDLAGLGFQTQAELNTRFTYSPAFNTTDPSYYAWGGIRGHHQPSGANPGNLPIHGPEVGFARTLYAAGWRDMAIIKVATNIPVSENKWLWSKGESFYTQWGDFIADRVTELEANGDRVIVRGFIWDEGIDDGMNPIRAAAYEANLTRLIADLRADYGTPETPFILARSNSILVDQTQMQLVRAAQLAVAGADAHASWIDEDDLETVAGHHFTAASQIVIGTRFAEAYLTHVPEPTTALLSAGMAAAILARRR